MSWIDAIITIKFDLEEGQMIDYIHPTNVFDKYEQKIIAYYSFPESCNFNKQEGNLFYFYKFKHYYCYNLYHQRKDDENERGYFQKSVIIISKLNFISIYEKLLYIIFKNINIENILDLSYNKIKNWDINFDDKDKILLKEKIDFNLSYQELSIPFYLKKNKELKPLKLKKYYKYHLDINLYEILIEYDIDIIFKLWELIILNKSLIVFAETPDIVSNLIMGIVSLIFPLKNSTRVIPYLNIFDPEYKILIEKNNFKDHTIIIGATNPLIIKYTQEFSNILRLDTEYKNKESISFLGFKFNKPNYLIQNLNKVKINFSMKKKFNKNKSKESNIINNSILRKSIIDLTQSFLMPINKYFNDQKNDLKKLNKNEIIKLIEETDFEIKSYYKNEIKSLIEIYKEFFNGNIFKNYINKNFNFFEYN